MKEVLIYISKKGKQYIAMDQEHSWYCTWFSGRGHIYLQSNGILEPLRRVETHNTGISATGYATVLILVTANEKGDEERGFFLDLGTYSAQ